ncbi:hypothetical protein [Maribacter sp. 2210JD10-5]
MTEPCQNFFWNTFWGIFADRVRDCSGYPAAAFLAVRSRSGKPDPFAKG